MSILDRKVLVLNKSWFPVNITNSFHAVCKLYMEKALVVDKDYNVVNFTKWIERKEIDPLKQINCTRFTLEAPDVILLKDYNGFKRKRARLSRAAIFTRDQNVCQYCSKNLPRKRLNIDHVIPKSRGGKSTWENLVVSCFPCNTKKGDRTPEEANMRLINKPCEPRWAFVGRDTSDVPDMWLAFFSDKTA